MTPEAKPAAEYAHFDALDIRVGTIAQVLPFPRARNPSYKIEVDLGPLGLRWSSAQVTNYSPEELLGSQVCCIVNFGARNIAGFTSEVLILGAPGEAMESGHTGVIVVSPRSRVEDGSALF
ncbi:tRNA-binding protein [Novosphingobium decolorationis]|uniref:tRNA-binding protein n=1 Tax=Novosphingobium decolorationis TaxID=2698673 RepID=A0ABX8E9L0_9SPHN|nr:tRNA-binding protein [Novosphingobium decolorationis]QVM84890.1 tRNA-binding protein [Novosphingobium decolorationis]